MRIFVAKCLDEECGWYGLLSECTPCGYDHDRPMCSICENDVETREIETKKPVFSLFCKHDWDILQKIFLLSPIEIAKQNNINVTDGMVENLYSFQQKVVLVLSCKKCGKLKKIIETNPC